MKYVGDISRQDAQVLATYARQSFSILEFGSGGSTQVIAQCMPPAASFFSVETEPTWIARTSSNLAKLGVRPNACVFVAYHEWKQQLANRQFDLIFDDGTGVERACFAREAFPLLKVGGSILFHDTRRSQDFDNVLSLVAQYYLEVEDILCNLRGSNITAVRKKIAEPYVNWNSVEGRTNWMAGYSEPPENFPELLE